MYAVALLPQRQLGFILRGFRVRHLGPVYHWIVPILLHGMGVDERTCALRRIFLAQNVDFYQLSLDLLGSKSPLYKKKQIWIGAYPSKRIINLLRVVH